MGARRIYEWHVRNGRLENSDDVPQDDKLIAAWEKLSARMAQEMNAE